MQSLSDSQICSAGLVLLGQNTIADISDTSLPNAVKCNSAYVGQRDALLRSYDWNFARMRAQLQQGPVPAFGWLYAFAVPDKFLAAREVNGNVYPWVVEGPFILTNGPAGDTVGGSPNWDPRDITTIATNPPNVSTAFVCNLIYTAQIVETGMFDPLFADLLAIRIASVLAMSILKAAAKSREMWALYEQRLGEAKRTDGNEGLPDRRPKRSDYSWIGAR